MRKRHFLDRFPRLSQISWWRSAFTSSVARALLCVMKVKVLATQPFRLFATPWTTAHQSSLSLQEYWSRLPFPSPGDLPDPGIKSRSPALQADSSPSEPRGKPPYVSYLMKNSLTVSMKRSVVRVEDMQLKAMFVHACSLLTAALQ